MNEKETLQRVMSVIQTMLDAEKDLDGVSQDFVEGYEQALSDVIESLEESADTPDLLGDV
jgi:hypothetical protein